ncbi:MAG: phosphodiester glycosidase family protein [Snowella sp.]
MAIVQRLLCVGLIGLGLASCGDGRSPITSSLSVKPSPEALPLYRVYELPHSRVHTLRIPVQGNFEVTVAVSPNLRTVAEFAATNQEIAALNGGFFDAQNEKTTAYLTQNSQIVGNPQENERLTQNPKLKPYLSQIFNRSEFRRYQCGTVNRYAIALHDAPIPPNCELKDALGGGPRLLLTITATEEGFWAENQGKVIRDAIALKQRNARTAIGIMPSGDLFWVMAAQKKELGQNSGLSLAELADFMRSQGIQEVLNLDGGSSSGMYYQGKIFLGKLTAKGEPVVRSVKSVLVLRSRS